MSQSFPLKAGFSIAMLATALQKVALVSIFSLLLTPSLQAHLFDNRYFFWYEKPFSRLSDQQFHCDIQPFITTASRAFDATGEEIEIPLLNGFYNQAILAKALVEAGVTAQNLLRSDWQTLTSIPWAIANKIESQGFGFDIEFRFWDYIGLGASLYFMHARSGYAFQIGDTRINDLPGDRADLMAENKQMHDALNLAAPQWSDGGIGDIDLYTRIGRVWEYEAKCRRIDAGITVGTYVPTGIVRDINNPASLPFGGNGHWGVYAGVDAEFELKEDILAGLNFSVVKRLRKSYPERFPFLNEPTNYGTVVANTLVDPGATVFLAPYLSLQRIRAGLGFILGYYMVRHVQDTFCTDCKNANTSLASERSAWGADHASVNLLYDFGVHKEERGIAPIITFSWDIPVDGIMTDHVPKTNFISIMFEIEI